jgi:undecaprenyl-diphosphatase
MNAFDYSILSWFTQISAHHPLLNRVVDTIDDSYFLKAGVLVTLCCWAWFRNGELSEKNKDARETIICAMLACPVSILIARLATLTLPFRVRPLADTASGLHFYSSGSFTWMNWSSFPSDHAIMFFTLTTCLFCISRALGWIALLQSMIMACLPRVYLGIHYPTDILAGAAIGVGIGLLAHQKAIRSFVARGPYLWMQKHPGSFYAVSFLYLYEVSVLFNDFRNIAFAVIKHL